MKYTLATWTKGKKSAFVIYAESDEDALELTKRLRDINPDTAIISTEEKGE